MPGPGPQHRHCNPLGKETWLSVSLSRAGLDGAAAWRARGAGGVVPMFLPPACAILIAQHRPPGPSLGLKTKPHPAGSLSCPSWTHRACQRWLTWPLLPTDVLLAVVFGCLLGGGVGGWVQAGAGEAMQQVLRVQAPASECSRRTSRGTHPSVQQLSLQLLSVPIFCRPWGGTGHSEGS